MEYIQGDLEGDLEELLNIQLGIRNQVKTVYQGRISIDDTLRKWLSKVQF